MTSRELFSSCMDQLLTTPPALWSAATPLLAESHSGLSGSTKASTRLLDGLYSSPLVRPRSLGYRGQNAVNGELGQGEDKPKSATKPTPIETLADLDIFR